MKKRYYNIILTGIVFVLFVGIAIVGFLAEAYDSHTFPTFLFLTSYDWLHNFYDRNIAGTDGATDNFNKVIVIDSNLFPIISAMRGDQEFPNAAMRNYSADGVRTSPNVNDYFNRSVAVAPNFTTTSVLYGDMTKKVTITGGHSYPKWVYVTDPGNNNIRRYQFLKIPDFIPPPLDVNSSEIGGDVEDTLPSNHSQPVIKQSGCNGCDTEHWYPTNINDMFDADKPLTQSYTANGVSDLLFLKRSNNDYPTGTTDFDTYTEYNNQAVVEFVLTVEVPRDTLDLTFYGNSSDQSSEHIFVGLNQGYTAANVHDPGPNAFDSDLWKYEYVDNISSGNGDIGVVPISFDVVAAGYTGGITSAWDVDSSTPGVQIRLSILGEKHGGTMIGKLEIDDIDREDQGFTIPVPGYGIITGGELDVAGLTEEEQTELLESRWANISGYLETVPPESYPGYSSYNYNNLSASIGYGFRTNTTFEHARNVKFRQPRDIDVYRDFFDQDNGAPTYIFVADTMNSRIQVFMNATGSAGETNAEFPIRPVRVKGPTDTSDTAQRSNELAMRPYYSVTSEYPRGYAGEGYGDGRKADWRFYKTVAGSSFANSTIGQGQGEFYYPHGIAVDQDPDTKDIYLFVADTYNHRIQIFRDLSGVSSQGITAKAFDFQYEKGWGSYPLQTTQTMTPPGPYAFRYPKGIDVARFKNNSSYLYVVDSKNYRLLKYKIGENPSGGISSIEAVAGYGYDGTDFTNNRLTNAGMPVHSSIYETNMEWGFWNAQDVETGYGGFYVYTTEGRTTDYNHSISIDGQDYGVNYLNNHMVYVTDYARNYQSISTDLLNMRVMQFIDNFQTITGTPLTWRTEDVTFETSNPDNLHLGQSVYGIFSGYYNSSGLIKDSDEIFRGSSNNVPGRRGYFTDRPAGIATVAWRTDRPIDMRVIPNASGNPYSNGASIPVSTQIRIGATSGQFFGLPDTTREAFLDYEAALDGLQIKRVHIFCYQSDGTFDDHSALPASPYLLTPSDISCTAGGYMKVIAEDKYFGYSGRSGTMIFRLQ